MTKDEFEQIWLPCKYCEDEKIHDILKNRNKKNNSFDGIVKCTECENVTTRTIKEKKMIEIKLLISDGDKTHKDVLKVEEGDYLQIGERVLHPKGTLEITRIEKGDKNIRRIESQKGIVVWTRNISEIKVNFSFNEGEYTKTFYKKYSFEEVFKIGRNITHENRRFRITNIMLKGGKKSKMAMANDVARIYCR